MLTSIPVENWGREFEKFAPSLEVRTYYGTQNERIYQRSELVNEMGQWDVCITTYNLAQGNDQDRKFFKRIDWEVRLLVLMKYDKWLSSLQGLRVR